MTLNRIPVRAESTLECRSCGAGAPVDEHFCPQCSRILTLGRHGDYFTFFGLPRQLTLDAHDLERRFRELSRKFHPDFYYNAPPAERLASLERSSYLNDAYRVLRNQASRIEYLLSLEGVQATRTEAGGVKVPPALLEEVFALNEELDEIREQREAGADAGELRRRLGRARNPIEQKRAEHERQLTELSARWDAQADAPAAERRTTLEALRDQLFEQHYIDNLLASIERELASLQASDSGLQAPGPSTSGPEPAARSPKPEVRE